MFASLDIASANLGTFSSLLLTLPGDLEFGTTYYVTIDPGAFEDLSGNEYLGLSGYSFTTNFLPSAVDDAAETGADAPFLIDVLANDNDVDGDMLSITAILNETNGTAEISGSSVNFTPAEGFTGTAGFDYTISDGNGGTDTGHVTVTVSSSTPEDTTPPSIIDTAPGAGSTGVNTQTDIVLTFDEVVETGSGFVSINTGASDGPVFASLDVESANLGMFSNLQVLLPGDLEFGTTYYVTIDPGAFEDLSGNQFLGLSDYFFTTNFLPSAIDDAASTGEDAPVLIEVLANDQDLDDDTLSIAAILNETNGTAEISGSSVNFTPAEGFTGTAGFDYTISDGNGGTDTGHVTVTVSSSNLPPVLSEPMQSLSALTGIPLPVVVGASDPDSDPLNFSASNPAHGSVTGGDGGSFVYTSTAGFQGTDNFTVTVSDGQGGSVMQSVSVSVTAVPAADDFRLFASDGYVGEIGGSGQVFGTAGFQDITVLDEAGIIAFDPSFNKGGDIIRLSGNAGDWQVVQSGSSALLSDGDTFVQIPVGTAGTAVVFDDGVRSLRFDSGAGSLKIGAQSFGTEGVQITAPTDGSPLPTGADEDASARLFLGPDKSASAGGHLDVFGTSGAEQLTVTGGAVTLDPSFNKGGDTLILGDPAPDFLASRSGSTVLLDGAATDVVIPVGIAGMTLAFPGDDERTLLFDTMLGNPVIGTQEIDTTPTALAAFG